MPTKETYVARTPIKYSYSTVDSPSHDTIVLLEPGDPLPDAMTAEEVLGLRQSGAAVPKRVHDALVAAATAQAQAAQEQLEAEQEIQRLQAGALGVVSEAEASLAEHQAAASTPQAAVEAKTASKAVVTKSSEGTKQ
jgi:hypothetical protein